MYRSLALLLVGLFSVADGRSQTSNDLRAAASARYTYPPQPDPEGIGKAYMGREIAQVMGHQGIDWLERPEREQEERPDLLLPALKLKAGDTVADVGAGSGYYTRRLARLVGDTGLVYAVDIQPEMLQVLTNKMAEAKIHNVKPVLGTLTDPRLPRASVDLALMVDVYHELDHPYEVLHALRQQLKPGGRMVLVEFRGEDPEIPIKRLHKMTEAQVRKELAVAGFKWVATSEVLPRQHILMFRRE